MEQATMHMSVFEVVGCAAARGHRVPVISKARGALAKWLPRCTTLSPTQTAITGLREKGTTWRRIICRDTSAVTHAHCSKVSLTLTLEAKAMITCEWKT